MANVDLHTKLNGNRPRNDWDTLAYVFPRWRPSAILELSFRYFGFPTTSSLVGFVPASGV